MKDFTHFDEHGNAAMVDISEKQKAQRTAIATGRINMSGPCYQTLRQGTMEKGDVLGVARIAGIMAAKQTPSLIPLCHALLIEKASIDFGFDDAEHAVIVTCTVKTTGVTGVEMEALTGVSVCLLTIYDMCKSKDKSMELTGIRLIQKTGGKSGDYKSERN